MKVEKIVLAIVIFSAIIIGMTSFQGSLMQNYGKPQHTKNITSLENAKKVQTEMEKIKTHIKEFDIKNPLSWGNVVGLGVDMFTIIFKFVPKTIQGIVTDIGQILNLGGWFAIIIETALLVVLVFGAYRAMRGGGV